MNTADPRDVLRHSAMSPLQVLIVGLTIALNALDGFDVTAISYASPEFPKNGDCRRVAGIVLSMSCSEGSRDREWNWPTHRPQATMLLHGVQVSGDAEC